MMPSTPQARPWRWVLVGSLFGTMAIGVWLRWALAGQSSVPFSFANLRHAHSHLGYFGLLFPLAWLGWKGAGAKVPGPRALISYAIATAITCAGFVHSGYGVVAIVGSTIVAAYWLWSAKALFGRMRRLQDPLGAVPLGIAASLACVPPVALNLRSNPALAHAFVSSFLSGLLLLVIVPSTLAGRRISLGPWPFLWLTGALGALALGALPHPIPRIGLLTYGALLLGATNTKPATRDIAEEPVPAHPALTPIERIAWGTVALGLAAMALGLLPNVRPVALGAIHFLILGPILSAVAPHWLPPISPSIWAIGHCCWGTMSAALVAQGFVTEPATFTIAAVGGSATLFWWLSILGRSLLRGARPPIA